MSLDCISEVSGWLVSINSGVQTFESSVRHSGKIGLFSVPRLVKAQLVVLPSAHTGTGESVALGDYLRTITLLMLS